MSIIPSKIPIALGEVFAKALGNKLGIERYGFVCLWMIV
jgi:imidazoleglycerol phosphate dehydratase HisB